MPRCSQTQCQIAETGVCLEGHKQGCPHLLPENAEPSSAAPIAQTTNATSMTEPRRFHTGEKLTTAEASRFLNGKPARVVLCVGSRRSGKTTFLARIGEMFRNGSFAKYHFAGSLTLCGFERATWLATIASGAGRPDTPRTRRVENDTFLHLCIRPEDDNSRKLDLLISDLAGETFPMAVATKEFCTDLLALGRADHLVVFLDCARLVDSAQRHTECDNARTFLQRAGAVKNQPRSLYVQVVFSRWDYVLRHQERPAQEKFCHATELDFKKRFGDTFAGLEFRRIAARPSDGIEATNGEIQSLFAHWIETPSQQSQPAMARNRQPVRDFSAFGLI